VLPSRNRYGIVGPIHPERLKNEAIALSIEQNPLSAGADGQRPGALRDYQLDPRRALSEGDPRKRVIWSRRSIAFTSMKPGLAMRGSIRSTVSVMA
jgi:hypothetical protein